jgi:hypothetical protein
MAIDGRSRLVVAFSICLAALPVRSADEDPSLSEVVARTARYVARLQEQLTG